MTSRSSVVAPASMARMTSPASRSAEARDSTTIVARAARASSVSRLSGSWEPIATTVAWSATSAPSNSGSRAVVAQQTMSAAATRPSTSTPARSRPTMSTCSIGRVARSAVTCAWAWGPRPKTSSRRASGTARWRTARAETAAVRTLVTAIPSTRAMGARVAPSKTTHTPWIRGSPPTVRSLTTGLLAAADGMSSSCPPSSSTVCLGESASGSRPPRSAASRASAACDAPRRCSTSAAAMNGRLIARRGRSSRSAVAQPPKRARRASTLAT